MKDRIIGRGSRLQGEKEIRMVEEALRYTVELFHGNDEIWPDQCERANSYLGKVKNLVQQLCRDSDQKLCSATLVPSPRSSSELIVMLYYTYEQLVRLQEIIAAFQPICRNSSRLARKRRAEIMSKLEAFMLYSDTIIQSIALFQRQETQRENFRSYSSVEQNAIPFASGETTNQSPEFTKQPFAYTIHGKTYTYLVPVCDDYLEERDAPMSRFIEEDQPLQKATERQPRTDELPDNVQSLINSIKDRQPPAESIMSVKELRDKQ